MRSGALIAITRRMVSIFSKERPRPAAVMVESVYSTHPERPFLCLNPLPQQPAEEHEGNGPGQARGHEHCHPKQFPDDTDVVGVAHPSIRTGGDERCAGEDRKSVV